MLDLCEAVVLDVHVMLLKDMPMKHGMKPSGGMLQAGSHTSW